MMDGNKEEAARCIKIAEAAIAFGDREHALKYVRIARRLDCHVPVEALLVACERLGKDDARSPTDTQGISATDVRGDSVSSKFSDGYAADSSRHYTKEQVKQIKGISMCKDYYAVLGLEKGCTGGEIRRAYKRLSLKVHPDKNKAPGAEEAFKTICKAFECLIDENSRRAYDRTASVPCFETSRQCGGATRRRTRASTMYDSFDDDCDPDEVFRSFFGYQGDVFRARHVPRKRCGTSRRRSSNEDAEGLGFLNVVHILPIFIVLMLFFVPYSEPEYFLRQSYMYHIPKITEKHGVQYYVKSAEFDKKYPQGSSSREKLEDDIFMDYRSVLRRYCNIELQRRRRLPNYPIPYCDKLKKLVEA